MPHVPHRFPQLNGAGRGALGALAAVLVLACGSDAPTAPSGGNPRFNIVLTVGTPDIHPGDEVGMTLDVAAPAAETVSDLRLVFSGLFADTLPIPVPGPGSFSFVITGGLPNGPFAGRLDIVATARLGGVADTARGHVNVADDGPPRLEVLVFNAGPEPADTMKIGVVAVDASGIASITYRLRGAMTYLERVTTPLEDVASIQLERFVPASTRLGDSVWVDVTVADAFGTPVTRTLPGRMADRRGPTLTVNRSPAPYDAQLPWRAPVYFTGDTMTVTVSAQDHFGIAWLAWRLRGLGLGDSVAGTDTAAALTWRLPVTAAMDGPGREVEFVARDSSGNETVRILGIDFADATRRRMEVLLPGWRDPWSNAVYEPAHGRVLLLDLAGFRLYSVEPFSYLGSGSISTNAYGLDVLPGGDTAVVGSMIGSALHRFAIGPNPVSAASTPEPVPYTPFGLRATPDGRMIISGATISLGDPGRLVFVNTTTWEPTIRNVSGFRREMTASADRSLILSYDEEGRVMTYRPAVDSFSAPTTIAVGIPSVDGRGTLVAVRNRLYDASLQYMRNIGPPAYDEHWSILSADGQYAYFALWPGLHKVRVSDGVTVERIFTPEVMTTLLEIPDRDRMLVGGFTSLTLVDLSPAGLLAPPGR